MIKFFRRTRQRLLTENHTRKYLLYALGEIALVVVGILIALQINNWSEWKKERAIEIRILDEIRDNIKVDFVDHEQNLNFMANTIHSSGIIINHLENELPFHDSLSAHFGWLPIIPDFYSVNSGYELLSSKGVNLITNDSLRKDISFLYDNTHIWVKEFFSFLKMNSYRLLIEDMVPKFRDFHSFESYDPVNYSELLKDNKFRSYVQFNMSYLRDFKGAYEDRIKLEQDLVERIGIEIAVLQN